MGSFLPTAFSNGRCCVALETGGDCQRRRHILIREEPLVKGASNPVEVVPGELAPGVFRSGCMVPCEISKPSNCMDTIPHVDKFSICNIDKNVCTRSGYVVPCEISKWSKYMETKISVFKTTYRAYEILKYQFLIIFR